MNLILLEEGEAASREAALDGRRAQHIREVLRARPGDVLRVGAVGGPVGTARVVSLDAAGVVLGDLRLDAAPPAPWFDLVLAVPRPKVLHRLWAPLASLGVRRIALVNAAKVERFYFDTHWLDPAAYAPLLREGLEQAGATAVPEVSLHRAFRPFVEDDVPRLFPDAPKFVAHPRLGPQAPAPAFSTNPPPGSPLPLVAVGPEGGWTDFELGLLQKAGFIPLTLGVRPLRTDVACAAVAGALGGASVSITPERTNEP